MCGRFTQRYTWRELVELYRLTQPARNPQPHHNICPTETIDAVIPISTGRELLPVRWGLIPYWGKKTRKELPARFNARAESVADKPMFRDAFKRRRCIVPASGYYEWRAEQRGKQPYYITAKDDAVPSLAGLWEDWKDVETGEPVRSCTIIITSANEAVRGIHDRMPVLLPPQTIDAWLSGPAGKDVLAPAPVELLRFWPVSRRVNNPGNDEDPTLIEPLAV
jgi:putative SOS response-associated peptidase YedK